MGNLVQIKLLLSVTADAAPRKIPLWRMALVFKPQLNPKIMHLEKLWAIAKVQWISCYEEYFSATKSSH